MRVITAKDVLGRITVAELVPVMEAAMKDISAGEALHPPRFVVPINEAGRMGMMYGALHNPRCTARRCSASTRMRRATVCPVIRVLCCFSKANMAARLPPSRRTR
ncbi:hypothetical protein ACFQFQ_24120 [Sulfitobacter porphyrae]|uniref:Ornithine cyclodeaminase n=1 Tax=Sulfitobacter porphyrae TaxID=1246864 RepID=A0ABW2B9J7_9RHOB